MKTNVKVFAEVGDKVVYNGYGNDYCSTNPNCLELGKEYKVISVQMHQCHCNYMLAGLAGEFSSLNFDIIS